MYINKINYDDLSSITLLIFYTYKIIFALRYGSFKDFFIFVCVWKPEDNPWKFLLSFHHEVPGMQLWLFTWLQAPLPTEPFCRPYTSTKLECGVTVEAEAGMRDGMDAGVCCL